MTIKKATVKKAVARRTPAEKQLAAVPSQSDLFLATIQAASADPAVDITKMERLYEMYKDVKANEARVEYNKAMSLAQAEMPRIERRHENKQTNSMYAKIDDIIRDCKPIWTSHGFSVSTYPADGAPDGFVRAECAVSHDGGETRTFFYDNPIDDKGIAGKVNKTQTHGRASGFSYAERYLIGMVFCLEIGFAGQDDDGNAAGAPEIERITDEQVLEIEAMINDNELDKPAFMKWVKQAIWVDNIEDIPVDWYSATIKTINGAIKAHEQTA